MSVVNRLGAMARGQAVIVGLAAAGVYYLLMFDDGSAARGQITTLDAQIAKDQTELERVNKALAQAEEYQKAKAEMGEQMDRIMKYIPEELTGSDLMKFLSTEAKASGVNILRVSDKSTGAQTVSFIQEVSVDVDLQGTFGQLLLFMSYLTRVEKIITMKNMRMAKSGASASAENLLEFSATFVGYRYTPPKAVKAGP